MPIVDPPYRREPVQHETYNPYFTQGGPRFGARRRFGTSPTELLHLAVATVVLTTAITIWMLRTDIGNFGELGYVGMVLVALGITVTGFAFHELAHKFTAQHYGHWSEFRFSLPGLLLAVVVATLGFLFAAPGATWHTATSQRDNGKISAAGPLLNIIVALIAFAVLNFTRDGTLANAIATGVLAFNVILAIFNLIPLGPLDGKKVLRWNPVIYIVLLGLGILLLFMADPFGALNG